MLKSTLHFVCVAVLLLGPPQLSAQRIVSEERHAWADTIPVDTLLARHVAAAAARGSSVTPYSALLSDYVADRESARGDTVFDAMLDIAENAEEHLVT